ncbi:MAG TPA: ribonuclease III domain-containing protein, partial [Methanomassiliicoccales archaeon]|nr:ribonuclease III domain-containing protein [Methanomassiliicoccales archaeon]
MSQTMEGAKERLEERLGYRFRSSERLDLALRHRSMGPENNERMEFLGDAVLSLIVSDHLAGVMPPLDEAAMTRRRSLLTD